MWEGGNDDDDEDDGGFIPKAKPKMPIIQPPAQKKPAANLFKNDYDDEDDEDEGIKFKPPAPKAPPK
jgi:hypothetical protein